MILIDLWLYGPLAQYAGSESRGSHAHLSLELPPGARMRDLLARLGVPAAEKGITFVNCQLTDMPGLAADLDLALREGDRVGIFHRQSMWPFQYRFGAAASPALQRAMLSRESGSISHSFTTAETGIAEVEGGGGDTREG